MSLTSVNFFLFLAGLAAVYALAPRRFRWPLLLGGSYFFYLCGGLKTVVYLLFTTLTTFGAGLLLGGLNTRLAGLPRGDKTGQAPLKRRKKLVVLAVCLLNFGLLFALKYWDDTATLVGRLLGTALPSLGLVMPLGVSFYIFQSVGYVIDVYRGKHPPQQNPAKFALFVSFFPQMVQGPISRYHQLSPQLLEGRQPDFEDLRGGIQLLLWGLLKKLLIAERIGVVANTVFSDQAAYPGSILLVGAAAYSVQLYCDFSGGIDIARGAAGMLGIHLVENFRRPLFAPTLGEFWRRWHITLGSWMRDYLFYPLSLSRPFGRLARWGRTHIKGKGGKILATSLATFLVYLVIGIWHGSSLKYAAYGMYNGGILTLSLLLEGAFAQWRDRLGIRWDSPLWRVFQIVRTNCIVLVGRYITRAPRLLTGLEMLRRTITEFHPAALTGGQLLELGLGVGDWLVVVCASLALAGVELALERGVPLRERLAERSAGAQFAAVFVPLLLLLFFGLGGNYVPAQFIYAQF